MATLEIRKETNKVWRHVPSDALPYIVSKLYIKSDGDLIRVVEQGGSQRGQYNFADVSVYNIGGVAETFGSAQQLMERLEALNYIGFFYEGEVSPSELISSDVDNAIELGTDGKLFAPISGGGGAVDSVNGQTGVVVLDATDVSALSNDTTDYTDATTPLAGTEIALVEQGGTFKKVAVSEFGGGGSSLQTFQYNTTSLCIFNFPATSNWTQQSGTFGMGAYGSARSDSGVSDFLTLISNLSNYGKIIGGIAPYDMELTSNQSFVTQNANLVGGDLKIGVGFMELDYTTNTISNATVVTETSYTPNANGLVDLRTDFTTGIVIPKGAIWLYSWAHTKASAVSSVYIQTMLNFKEVV